MRLPARRHATSALLLCSSLLLLTGCGADAGGYMPAGMSSAATVTGDVEDPVLAGYDGIDSMPTAVGDDLFGRAASDFGDASQLSPVGMTDEDPWFDEPMPGYGSGYGYDDGYGYGAGIASVPMGVGWDDGFGVDDGFVDDAGMAAVDAGFEDVGFDDAGFMDVGAIDAGMGAMDVASVDAGVADIGAVDVGGFDAGFVDAGIGF